MLANSEVMTFVATTDAARAQGFYEDSLGLTFVSDEAFALVFDLNGTMLRIQKVESITAPPYTSLGWHVDDIDLMMCELISLASRSSATTDSSRTSSVPGRHLAPKRRSPGSRTRTETRCR